MSKKVDEKTLQVRISMEMWSNLQEIAKYNDRNVSSLVRVLIKNAWKRHQLRKEEEI